MKQKVIVIGAGVIGCNLADELIRRGASVTVIDAAEAGSGTSSATFAWVNANNKAPDEYYYLNHLGMQAHERAARSAAENGARWFHQIGTVQVSHSGEKMSALENQVENLRADGYEARMLSPAEVQELEPSLNPTRISGGAWYPKEGWIDVNTMCLALLDRALERGAVFAPYQTVTNVQAHQVTTMASDGSTRHYDADVVVLAAGNGNKKILAAGGIDFPTIDPSGATSPEGPGNPTVGIISTTGVVNSGITHLIRTDGIALRPARNGGITFADSPTGGKWELSDPGIWTLPALLLDRARELYPSLNNTTTESVSLGTRVLPEDGLTIADWIIADQSVYAVATHSGVTLSAYLAEVVAEEIHTGNRHPSLQAFGLSRFATT